MGRPPPLIWATPERKRFFSIDVFPKVRHGKGAFQPHTPFTRLAVNQMDQINQMDWIEKIDSMDRMDQTDQVCQMDSMDGIFEEY